MITFCLSNLAYSQGAQWRVFSTIMEIFFLELEELFLEEFSLYFASFLWILIEILEAKEVTPSGEFFFYLQSNFMFFEEKNPSSIADFPTPLMEEQCCLAYQQSLSHH